MARPEAQVARKAGERLGEPLPRDTQDFDPDVPDHLDSSWGEAHERALDEGADSGRG